MEEEFVSCLNEVSNTLKRLIFYLVNDSFLCDDLYQETIIKAYQKFETLHDRSKFQAWVFQIARNTVKDYYRQVKEKVVYMDQPEVLYEPKEELHLQETKERVEELLNKLPPHDKMILSLFYLGNYSINQIAERLRIPIGTVKSRLNHARNEMRKYI